MRRCLPATAMVALLAVSLLAATVLESSPASAASSATCSKLTGFSRGAYKFDLKRCTPTSVDEVLRGLGADLVRVGGPISHSWEWNDGDTTTVSITVVQAGTCPAGSTAYTVTGTVTGGTSTYTQPGDAIHLAVCRRTAPYMYQVRLASGSSALL